MSCSAARCALGQVAFQPIEGVKQMASDRTGAITIDFDLGFLPQGQRRMTLVPMIGEQVADLSHPAAAGATITWGCSGAQTTVPRELLPLSCR